MLMLPPSVRIYVALAPVDGRKGMNALAGLAQTVLAQDPLSGHLFVFLNRRRDGLRVLFWDRTGWMLVSKRLARGCFHLPTTPSDNVSHLEIEAAELALILEGIELQGARRRVRWVAPRGATQEDRVA